MTRATHLAWTNGRVQKAIANGIKESLSVPILDAKALDSGKERRQSDAYPLVARAGVRQLSRDRRRSGVARRHTGGRHRAGDDRRRNHPRWTRRAPLPASEPRELRDVPGRVRPRLPRDHRAWGPRADL